jgi:hypothetical protein
MALGRRARRVRAAGSRGKDRRPTGSRASVSARPGDGDSGFAGLGGRTTTGHRNADLAVSGRADRHGGKPALPLGRNPGNPRVRPPVGVAKLGLQPSECSGVIRRSEGVRHGCAVAIRLEPRLTFASERSFQSTMPATLPRRESTEEPGRLTLCRPRFDTAPVRYSQPDSHGQSMPFRRSQ